MHRKLSDEDAVFWSRELFDAVRERDVSRMQQAIEAGADVNSQFGDNFMSPLHRAAQRGLIDAVNLLLRNGADPDLRTRRGYTALHEAGSLSYPEIANALLDYGANPDIYNRSGTTSTIGDTPLCKAAIRNSVPTVEAMLAAGCDPMRKVQLYNGSRVSQGLTHSHRRTLAVLEAYEQLPRLTRGQDISKAELLKKDAAGKCLLDNPLTWRQWESIAPALKEKGESFSKAELFAPAADGRPFLRLALDARSLRGVVADLNRQGEVLTLQELLPHIGDDPSLLQRPHLVRAVFTPPNMGPQGRVGFYAALETLPPEGRELVINRNILSTFISHAERDIQHGR